MDIPLNLDHLGDSEWRHRYPNLFPEEFQQKQAVTRLTEVPGTPVPPESTKPLINDPTLVHAINAQGMSYCGLKPGGFTHATTVWQNNLITCGICKSAAICEVLQQRLNAVQNQHQAAMNGRAFTSGRGLYR